MGALFSDQGWRGKFFLNVNFLSQDYHLTNQTNIWHVWSRLCRGLECGAISILMIHTTLPLPLFWPWPLSLRPFPVFGCNLELDMGKPNETEPRQDRSHGGEQIAWLGGVLGHPSAIGFSLLLSLRFEVLGSPWILCCPWIFRWWQ